jgi:RsmE family RNA methyltransferase
MNIILFETMPSGQVILKSENSEIFDHIVRVLKLKEGDVFRMGIINESEGTATVKSMDSESIAFEYSAVSVPSLYPVTLIVAQVRPICMKRILREAVSLGAGRIILCTSDTGEKSYRSSTLYSSGEYRWYLEEGAMQSAHAGLPEVVFADNVTEAVKVLGDVNDTSLYLLDNVVGAENLSSCNPFAKAVVAIGPERGWSDRERRIFRENGFEPVLLGSRVLRTETACSTGLAVLLSRMGLL